MASRLTIEIMQPDRRQHTGVTQLLTQRRPRNSRNALGRNNPAAVVQRRKRQRGAEDDKLRSSQHAFHRMQLVRAVHAQGQSVHVNEAHSTVPRSHWRPMHAPPSHPAVSSDHTAVFPAMYPYQHLPTHVQQEFEGRSPHIRFSEATRDAISPPRAVAQSQSTNYGPMFNSYRQQYEYQRPLRGEQQHNGRQAEPRHMDEQWQRSSLRPNQGLERLVYMSSEPQLYVPPPQLYAAVEPQPHIPSIPHVHQWQEDLRVYQWHEPLRSERASSERTFVRRPLITPISSTSTSVRTHYGATEGPRFAHTFVNVPLDTFVPSNERQTYVHLPHYRHSRQRQPHRNRHEEDHTPHEHALDLFRATQQEERDFLEAQTQSLHEYQSVQSKQPPSTLARPTLQEAHAGFTRSIVQNVVCVSCDSPLSSSTWLLRECGHVYCRDCAQAQDSTKCSAVHCCLSSKSVYREIFL